ncbi:MAG: class I SAM-dependent methyltransferase [Bryobacteraceae bacterium]
MEPISSDLHRVWKDVIQAEDYELHMAAIGQAQANATLTRELLLALDLPADAGLLIAGAGPGQMFEFVSPDFLAPFEVTFSDINETFLRVLAQRLRARSFDRFHTVVDDIENTKITPGFAAALLTLVLEHVDWKKALAEVARLGPGHLIVIIQENPPAMTTAVSPGRTLPPSMRNLGENVRPHLIDRAELVAHLAGLRYELTGQLQRAVPDAKWMHGLTFNLRSPTEPRTE